MPPKHSAGGGAQVPSTSFGGGAAVPSSSTDIPPPNGSRLLPASITDQSPEVSQDSSVGSPAPLKRQSTLPEPSPKKMVRRIANVTLMEWKERCPPGSQPGSTGIGSTYAILISQEPVALITTKKDQRRVSKKTIIIGDCTGQRAEISIWGLFAARSWMYPEGTVLLLRNLKFHQYFQDNMQLKFADVEPNYEMLITKADDSLDITKELKLWYSNAGVSKILTIEEVGRKARNTMVSNPSTLY
jgi:hypothetical protein